MFKAGRLVGVAAVRDEFGSAARQLPYATALALNETANAASAAIKAAMPQVFDRPTPYAVNAVQVLRASRENLSATVRFRDSAGKNTAADKFLGPQVQGGARGSKRSENAFRRAGLLAPGQFIYPGAAADLDQYGNVSRGQVVQLLSYLQLFGEQGYRANATARSRKAREKRGKTAEGYRTINGVAYVVSRGRGMWYGRQQHLPAGVWAKRGTHGADVRPVWLFGKAPSYRPRLDFYGIADRVQNEQFSTNMDAALAKAMSTAR
ncbi:Uncharacterised protein [Bordetella ansorpii]|uniref:Phage protein n=1 Tax=Bordetella ansorpii TaxID=288768 RepID=A0A157RLT9_9BORD|nr:hypothetical protein [Bordetella ansorpii]SAI58962.1 Uncharacterised protein [Bordetella ansorpii]